MRRSAGLALCVAVLAACSSNDESSSPSTTAAAASSTSTISVTTPAVVDDSVITRYLAALDGGDIAAANALRCEKGRIPDDTLALFESEVASVKAAAGGSLTLGQASIVDPITLGSLYGERPDSQVAFSLQDADGETSMLAVAVITENDQPVLCGAMQEGSPGVQSAVSAATA